MNAAAKEYIVLGVVTVAGIYLVSRLIGNAASAAGSAVNPTSEDNLVYQAINGVGDILNDGKNDDDFSLGSWVYDWMHPDEYPAPPASKYNQN